MAFATPSLEHEPLDPKRKTFVPLEINPIVMNHLSHSLGLSPQVSFHDVYSLTEPDLLALLPRPCMALLFIFPMTPTSEAFWQAEDAQLSAYTGSGPQEPVLWYRQTIRHACGLIGTLHCITNGESQKYVSEGSELAQLIKAAEPLKTKERSQLLYDSKVLEAAHADAACKGDTAPPENAETWDDPHAFVAFVKGKDSHLYELEGRRKGPLDRGVLAEDEDVLSPRALDLSVLRNLRREEEAGNGELRFSCLALGPTRD